MDHCTISDCLPGILATHSSSVAISNSIILRCGYEMVRASQSGSLTLSRCLLDENGGMTFGRETLPFSSPTWEEKPLADVLRRCILRTVSLPDILAGLSEESPHLEVSAHGTVLGARPQVRHDWIPYVSIEVIPVTIYTHGVGRTGQE